MWPARNGLRWDGRSLIGDECPRVPGGGNPRPPWRAGEPRTSGGNPRRGSGDCGRIRRHCCGEGPGAHGGTRQGRRHQACPHAGRGARRGRSDPRHGHQRAYRQQGAGGQGREDRPRVLSRGRPRPAEPESPGHGQCRGRRRYRTGCPRHTRQDREAGGRPRPWLPSVPGARAGVRAGSSRGEDQRFRRDRQQPLRCLPEGRRHPGRDQPVDPDRGRRLAGARLEDELRRQRAVPSCCDRGFARPRRRERDRGRCAQERHLVRQAGWRHRLHR